ncbi:DivIVA domain-containing protein [Janibacter indicus]|uniref:DivIVA domain-containing protein n=1 Tax=Janibacter indicus TaxID=857417 RepID=A0A1W1ZAP8_9MICO|nr:DivIVA domain-containing protein [Janibacter indicus]SMC45503.1 DivIVA domain-containing protein [Janibacter indicus]
MVWIFFVLVALLVVVAIGAAVTGRITPDPMAEAVSSAPDPGLPSGDFRAEDVDAVRFDTALRGYRMDQVDDVLDRLQQRIAELESAREAARTDDGAHHE